MTHATKKPAAKSTSKDLVNTAACGVSRNIETLQEWLIIHPKDWVVVAKNRMYVVQRDGDMAKVAVYPQLPSVFYSGHTAHQIAAGFKCYIGGEQLIELEAVRVREFATAAIVDLRKRLIDLNELLEVF